MIKQRPVLMMIEHQTRPVAYTASEGRPSVGPLPYLARPYDENITGNTTFSRDQDDAFIFAKKERQGGERMIPTADARHRKKQARQNRKAKEGSLVR